MTEETIVKIHGLIRWLEDNRDSQNVNEISIHLGDLAIHSMYFGEQVSDAYADMNNSEEKYKGSVAKFVAKSTGPAAKSEREAEVLYEEDRKAFIDSKNLFKKLNSKLDRIDKILDHYKQRVSVIKQTDLKHV